MNGPCGIIPPSLSRSIQEYYEKQGEIEKANAQKISNENMDKIREERYKQSIKHKDDKPSAENPEDLSKN